MSKERMSDQLVFCVKPSVRARLEQEAESVGIDLSNLARLKLEQPLVQLPQHEAA